MRHFEVNISDLSHHQIKMLWLSKSLIFFIVGNVFSESMHEASLIEEMDQFIKETRTNKDILNFENYESVLKDFETYPIVSSSEKNSSWCEVTGRQHNILFKIFNLSFRAFSLSIRSVMSTESCTVKSHWVIPKTLLLWETLARRSCIITPECMGYLHFIQQTLIKHHL